MPPSTTTRKPTAEERALLGRPSVRLFGWWTGLVSAACVFALVFLVVALAAVALPYTVVVRTALVAAALMSVGWYVWVQRKVRVSQREQEAQSARELATAQVRSTIYTIKDAVAVEEFEDDGPSYYLLLDDGRTLFLSGQYLYEPVESGFPWQSFEVVRAASGNWVLRIVPLGPPLKPSQTRAPFSRDELKRDAIIEDGSITPQDFDALKVS